jgi:hypothetical protein
MQRTRVGGGGEDAAIIGAHVDELRRNVHTRKLKELIGPYATVRLAYIATALGMGSADEVEEVRRPFPSCPWSILAEIYLCHACSDREIEDGHARTAVRAAHPGRQAAGLAGPGGRCAARRGRGQRRSGGAAQVLQREPGVSIVYAGDFD